MSGQAGRASMSEGARESGSGAICDALTGARKSALALPAFPGPVPTDLEAAYRIQDRSLSHWPTPIVGWKVGGFPPAYQERYDARYLAGPVDEAHLFHARPGTEAAMPVFEGGFAAVEAEFVVRLGESRTDDALFLGVEIASSPVPELNGYGPLAVICDFGNNNGLLVGREVDAASLQGAAVEVETVIDGRSVGSLVVDNAVERAHAARDFLLDNLASRGIAAPAGTYICTGALTGIHEAVAGSRSTVRFGDLGSLDIVLVPAQPL